MATTVIVIQSNPMAPPWFVLDASMGISSNCLHFVAYKWLFVLCSGQISLLLTISTCIWSLQNESEWCSVGKLIWDHPRDEHFSFDNSHIPLWVYFSCTIWVTSRRGRIKSISGVELSTFLIILPFVSICFDHRDYLTGALIKEWKFFRELMTIHILELSFFLTQTLACFLFDGSSKNAEVNPYASLLKLHFFSLSHF